VWRGGAVKRMAVTVTRVWRQASAVLVTRAAR
jgi:hypothetical protein